MSRKKGYSEILSKLFYVREEKRSSYLRYFKEKNYEILNVNSKKQYFLISRKKGFLRP